MLCIDILFLFLMLHLIICLIIIQKHVLQTVLNVVHGQIGVLLVHLVIAHVDKVLTHLLGNLLDLPLFLFKCQQHFFLHFQLLAK